MRTLKEEMEQILEWLTEEDFHVKMKVKVKVKCCISKRTFSFIGLNNWEEE